MSGPLYLPHGGGNPEDISEESLINAIHVIQNN